LSASQYKLHFQVTQEKINKNLYMRTLNTISVLASAALLLGSVAFAQDAAAPAPADATAAPAKPVAVGKGQEEVIGQPGVVQDKRIFGVLPNYRTAEGSVAYSPITVKQKFVIATKDTLSYPSYLLGGAFAGISQLTNSNPSFARHGWLCETVRDQYLGSGAWKLYDRSCYAVHSARRPAVLPQRAGAKWGRVGYALSRIVVTKTDSGGSRFNFSEWVGNGSVAAIGNLYYPNDKGLSQTLQRTASQVGTDAISDILKEFWPDVKRHFFHKGPGE
jgi:hypothetical protein